MIEGSTGAAVTAISTHAERLFCRVLRVDPCAYCGGPGGTVDHIVAPSHGGADTTDNLTGACGPCNTAKGGWPLLPFLLLHAWMPAAREAS